MKVIIALILVILLIEITNLATITCPSLTCDEVIGDNLCYLHSSDNPVTSIRMFKCPTNEV